MFDHFKSMYRVTTRTTIPKSTRTALPSLLRNAVGASQFFRQFAGATFNEGLYRVHNLDEVLHWTGIVCAAFPAFTDKIQCFCYDWLGRQFALDSARVDHDECLVLMLDVGAGEALEIPATFYACHEEELVNDSEAALALNFFQRWKDTSHSSLQPSQCVGYKRPLFLGGTDDLNNLEVIDLEVYWTITGQLLNGV